MTTANGIRRRSEPVGDARSEAAPSATRISRRVAMHLEITLHSATSSLGERREGGSDAMLLHGSAFRHGEPWLHAVADGVRPLFAELDSPLPTNIRLTCDLSSRRTASAGDCAGAYGS